LGTPPFEIPTGVNANTGIVDTMRLMAQKELSQYPHIAPLVVNKGRFERLIKQGRACHAGAIRKEQREKFMYFSVAFSVISPFSIITTKETQQTLLGGATSFYLKDLLDMSGISIVLPSRTLGPIADPILARHGAKPNISYRMGVTAGGELFSMLVKGRADFTIAYPHEKFYWSKNNDKFHELAVIEIIEIRDETLKGRIACSKNSWGKQVIENLNAFIAKDRKNDSFHESLYSNWVPQDALEDILTRHKEELLKETWSNTSLIYQP